MLPTSPSQLTELNEPGDLLHSLPVTGRARASLSLALAGCSDDLVGSYVHVWLKTGISASLGGLDQVSKHPCLPGKGVRGLMGSWLDGRPRNALD